MMRPVGRQDGNGGSPVGEHDSPRLAGVAEAAAALGLTADGVRARIRRGTLPARKGNDGQWRVVLPAAVLSRQDNEQDRRDVPAADRQDAPLWRLAQIEALAEERIARARAEGERDAAQAESAVLREALAREADYARQERARADRLEAALTNARKGWLERLLEAVWRR
jgi:hypothetical protein